VLEKQGPISDWTSGLEVRHFAGPQAIAIVGISHGGYAIVGADDWNGIGVHGKTPMGIGVDGGSEQGTGVHGQGWQAGVEGEAPGEDHPGVRAESRSRTEPYALDGGLALEVIGKARFSTAGAGAVPRGRRMTTVAEPAVTAVSHITVTLTGNPGLARFDWVERQPGAGFVVHLQGVSLSEIPFTYLVVEPGA
jgi:hypothetical protein